METHTPFILVICGPPASGKSYLLRALRAARKDIKTHEMDEVRLEILPGPLNDKAARGTAYRVMHYRAAQDLLNGYPVAVCATYMPTEYRAEIAALALRLKLDLFVVQCVCPPDEAVKRFQARQSGHAGSDLTSRRVKQLSEEYERFDGALLLNTLSEEYRINTVNKYIASGQPVDPIQWARHPYSAYQASQDINKGSAPDILKLSEASVRIAKRHRTWYRFGYVLVWLSIIIGVVPLIHFFLYRYEENFKFWHLRSGWMWSSIRAFLTGIEKFWTLTSTLGFGELAEWGTFFLALAGFGSILYEYSRNTRKHREEANRTISAGDTSRYSLIPGPVVPSDSEAYHAYYCRIKQVEAPRMPIRSVPLFFLILPSHRVSFSVLARRSGSRDLGSSIVNEAAECGLDWNGFAAWLYKARRKEYAITYSHEYGLRCVGLDDGIRDGVIYFDASRCSYDDYRSRELAINFCAPGSLPDMRRLLEGRTWDEGDMDLLNLADSSRRFSMKVSVTGLVLTSDDYFILQKRSAVVGHGLGSLAASVNGAADFYADCVNDSAGWKIFGKAYSNTPYSLHPIIHKVELDGPPGWDLAKTALRELREELGIDEFALDKSGFGNSGIPPFNRPFTGAAYNLRYGRDLNFYSCFRTVLGSEEISGLRKHARDKWEVENLVFVHRDQVNVRSIESGKMDRILPNRARHLLGAFYSWAVYAQRH